MDLPLEEFVHSGHFGRGKGRGKESVLVASQTASTSKIEGEVELNAFVRLGSSRFSRIKSSFKYREALWI